MLYLWRNMMNRARRKKHKHGTMKRLVRESLFLSSTRYLSSRVVRFFEAGLASPLLRSVKAVDGFVSEKVTGPLFKKTELRKNLSMPARNSFAAFLSRNPVLKGLAAFRNAALNVSLRSVGIFLLTFGIYAAAIFLLKRYISLTLGAANTDDLAFSAITFAVGLVLTMFGDKSIISALSGGRITGGLLSDCLGVNESAFGQSSKAASGTAVGISFLLGSLFGVLTLFYSPASIMSVFATVLILLTILHIPEFGLLSAVAVFTFVPFECIAVLIAVTFGSFILKCLRLKRNFRFGTADAVVLLLFVVMLIVSLISGGTMTMGEVYLLCLVAVYFLVKNLICSERLVKQSFNALCLGVRIGMVLYILGEFAMYIPHDNLRATAYWLTDSILDAEMLAMMAVSVLPFAFSSFSAWGTKRSERLTVLLVIACAVVTDSFLFYALAMCALFIYIMFAHKAPIGALVGAGLVLAPAFSIISNVVSSSAVDAGVETAIDSVLGVDFVSGSFWGSIASVNGVICTVLFVAAALLALQRVLGCMAINQGVQTSRLCGTVAASLTIIFVCSFVFNPFSDLRVIAAMWFMLGLCGSVYQICTKSSYGAAGV